MAVTLILSHFPSTQLHSDELFNDYVEVEACLDYYRYPDSCGNDAVWFPGQVDGMQQST